MVLQKIPTGCNSIDRILEGGLPSGSINLIYGEAETGKTTVATQCAVNCALQGYKTLFVDCDSMFSARRLSQIGGKNFEKISELIILMKPNSFREQATVVDQLAGYVTKNFGLIVIDTITSLYRLRVAELPSKTFELNRELNRQLASLAQYARTSKIAVMLTSQVRSTLGEASVDVVPVATRVLKFWADAIIELKHAGNSQLIIANLEKSPANASQISCNLKIVESGIHEC
jgi:DNA repair protein RadB